MSKSFEELSVAEQKLATSIANKLGKDGVNYFIEHGEIPPVKLTSKEMEFLKGGYSESEFSADAGAVMGWLCTPLIKAGGAIKRAGDKYLR
jgi:hypothetical protein